MCCVRPVCENSISINIQCNSYPSSRLFFWQWMVLLRQLLRGLRHSRTIALTIRFRNFDTRWLRTVLFQNSTRTSILDNRVWAFCPWFSTRPLLFYFSADADFFGQRITVVVDQGRNWFFAPVIRRIFLYSFPLYWGTFGGTFGSTVISRRNRMSSLATSFFKTFLVGSVKGRITMQLARERAIYFWVNQYFHQIYL